jgi:transcriptional regulator
MAKANPHSRQLAGRRSLAVFSGPHAYVSPTWYQSENTVPTWNYAAVHAYGTCEILDSESTMRLLEETVNEYESGMPAPWSFDGSSDYFHNLAKTIVGFRMTIERIDAKAKLNQNHPAERRMRVIAELEQSSGSAAREIAGMMRQL